MSAILDEWCCCQPLRQGEIEAFIVRGVPLAALVRPEAILRDRVVYLDDGRFEFTRWIDDTTDATGALIFLVRSVLGDPLDLVAWTPGLERLANWYGYAGMLGEEAALDIRVTDGLRVFRSPWGWLQATRRGVVVVDMVRARSALMAAQPLQADDLQHGRDLRAALADRPVSILIEDRSAA